VPAEEGREPFLKLRARAARGFFGDALKCETDLPRASFPWVALQEIREREPIPAVQVFGLLDIVTASSVEAAAARSKIVRWTEVTGIPSWTARSSSGTPEMCLWIAREDRLRCPTVTSIRDREFGRIPQSAAADQWLSSPSGPEASTAAIHRPCREINGRGVTE
jgi:hypothetical protein